MAFTLAEVLITLGIIGVVAALTIPTLMQKTQDREAVSKLRKVYSTLQNAYNRAEEDNGTPENWNLMSGYSPEGAKNFLDIMAPYLNIMKNCGTSDESCYSLIVGGSAAKIILSDGVMIYFATLDANCSMNLGSGSLANGCAFADVDINGNKKPNIGGKDIFSFWITKDGFVPYGTPKQNDNDSASNPVSFARCEQEHGGRGCAAWVIYNENMDYLHCDGLSWTGKTKCD